MQYSNEIVLSSRVSSSFSSRSLINPYNKTVQTIYILIINEQTFNLRITNKLVIFPPTKP